MGFGWPRYGDDYRMIDPKDLNAAPNSDRLYSSYVNDQPRHIFLSLTKRDILFLFQKMFMLPGKSQN